MDENNLHSAESVVVEIAILAISVHRVRLNILGGENA